MENNKQDSQNGHKEKNKKKHMENIRLIDNYQPNGGG